jgi:Cys-tRNA(Pro)/Cys-tRNA(Cys) deacylase
MAAKTNSMRLLESREIEYEVFTFSPSIHSAQGVADALGLEPTIVYKTLVVLRKEKGGKPMLVMLPGTKEVDLRTLAASVGEKKLRMATQKEAEKLTGLQVGGISALALLNRGFDVYIDDSARDIEHIVVSAGKRGINLRLAVSDLLNLTDARYVNV